MKGYYNVFPSHIYSLDPYLHFININILILISHLEENRKHKTVRQHKWVEKACDKQLTAFVAVWNMLNMTWNKKKKKIQGGVWSAAPVNCVWKTHKRVCLHCYQSKQVERLYLDTHLWCKTMVWSQSTKKALPQPQTALIITLFTVSLQKSVFYFLEFYRKLSRCKIKFYT